METLSCTHRQVPLRDDGSNQPSLFRNRPQSFCTTDPRRFSMQTSTTPCVSLNSVLLPVRQGGFNQRSFISSVCRSLTVTLPDIRIPTGRSALCPFSKFPVVHLQFSFDFTFSVSFSLSACPVGRRAMSRTTLTLRDRIIRSATEGDWPTRSPTLRNCRRHSTDGRSCRARPFWTIGDPRAPCLNTSVSTLHPLARRFIRPPFRLMLPRARRGSLMVVKLLSPSSSPRDTRTRRPLFRPF